VFVVLGMVFAGLAVKLFSPLFTEHGIEEISMRSILIVLHLLVGVSAVGAGLALATEPSGETLTFETEWLDGSPFDDYLIPGLFLAVVNGGLNLASAYGLATKKWWGSFVSLSAGVVLVAWIVIQWLIIGYQHWSQPMWGVVFATMLLLALPRASRAVRTIARH
jgi:hypothetical protein